MLLRLLLAASVALAPFNAHAATEYIYRNIKPPVPQSGDAVAAIAYVSSTGAYGRSISLVPNVSGLSSPIAFAVTAGSLPSGVGLNTASGTISGNVRGNASAIQVTATDSTGKTAVSPSFSIQATAPAVLSYTTTSYSGRVGVPLTTTSPLASGLSSTPGFAASNGPLPPGLSIDPQSGAISGSPTTPGSYPVTIKATAADGSIVTSNGLTFSIGQPSISYKDAAGVIGSSFSLSPTVSFLNSPQFEVTGGTLPGGLRISPTTGAIYGTPTASGTAQITVHGYDSSAAQAYSPPFNLSIAAGTITISPSSLSYKEGDYVSLTATSTLSNPTWTYAGVPPWLNMTPNASNGVLYGNGSVPTVSSTQTFPITVTATSGSQSVSQSATLTVGQAKTSFTTVAAGRIQSPYTFRAGVKQTTDGGGGSWIAYCNCNDLTNLSVQNNVLTGYFPQTATTGSTYPIGVAYGGALASTTLRLYAKFGATVAPNVQANSGTDFRLFAPSMNSNSVIGTVTWFATSPLPTGVNLDPLTGQFYGNAATPGTYTINLAAVDSFDNANLTATQTLTIVSSTPQVTMVNNTQGSAAYSDGVTWTYPTTVTSSASNQFTLTGAGVATANNITVTGSGDASDPGSMRVDPSFNTCTSLAQGKTCTFFVNFSPSSGGQKTGSFTVSYDGMAKPLTFNLAYTAASIQQAGRMIVTSATAGAGQTVSLPVAKKTTVRYLMVAPGSNGHWSTNYGEYGGNSGQVVTGTIETDASGSLYVYVPNAPAVASSYVNYPATSIRGPSFQVNAVANDYRAYSGAGGRKDSTASGLLQGMPGGSNGSGGQGYQAGNGAGARFWMNDSTGQPASVGSTTFKLATISPGAGGAGGPAGQACSGGGSIRSGGGGGGGILIDGAGPSAGDGSGSGLQGHGGQGYGAGGGGGLGVYGGSVCGVPSQSGGVAAPGVVYLEWDLQ